MKELDKFILRDKGGIFEPSTKNNRIASGEVGKRVSTMSYRKCAATEHTLGINRGSGGTEIIDGHLGQATFRSPNRNTKPVLNWIGLRKLTR